MTHQTEYHRKAPKGVNDFLKLGQLIEITKLNNQRVEVASPIPKWYYVVSVAEK